MCPSYMATRDEQHSTRGRANVLRLAMAGRLGEAGLGDRRRLRRARPVPRVPRVQGRVPGRRGHGALQERVPGRLLAAPRHAARRRARSATRARWRALGSAFAPLSNWVARSAPGRALNEAAARHRPPPARCRRFERRTLGRAGAPASARAATAPLLFDDTFTNYYDPEIGAGRARRAGGRGRAARRWRRNGCCGRPQISKGLLARRARRWPRANADALYADAAAGRPIVFCEPSCLSAVREDAPALLRGEARRKAPGRGAARACCSRSSLASLGASLPLARRPGARPAPRPLPSEVDGARRRRPRRCCRAIPGVDGRRSRRRAAAAWPGRSATPAITTRSRAPSASGSSSPPCAAAREGTVVVAAGTSCRHQIHDFTGVEAVHPAVLLRSLLLPKGPAHEPRLALARRARRRDDRELRHRAERRRPRAGAGVAGRRLRRRHRRSTRC